MTNPTAPTSVTATGGATSDPTDASGEVTGSPTTDPTSGSVGTTGGGGDGCCESHNTPGCNEPAVNECVCLEEASCCVFEWDANCVDIALNDCMATCEEPATSSGDGTTTGPQGTECADFETVELQPSDATLSGAWVLGMSQVGEGEIIRLNQMAGTEGSILFEPDIPCADTWYIWVRAWESGNEDSYFATLDGEPDPPAIFEKDCTGGGDGYAWTPLNYRDQAARPCTYEEDPWAPQWEPGRHAIEFTFRESLAMGRLLLTNDPDFIP